MQLENAKAIVDASNEMGTELDLRERYSGRSMYGQETAAIVGSLPDIIAAAAWAAVGLVANHPDNDPDAATSLIEDLQHLRFDSMGRSDSVVY